MRVTKSASDKNKADILVAAGRTIREHGLAQASVGEIGKMAGLTHGALYRHFSSKSAVAAAAIIADFETIVVLLETTGENGYGLAPYLQAYLAADHRDYFIWGCPAAPLAAEIARSDDEVQTAFHTGLRRNVMAIANLLHTGNEAERFKKASVILATLAGTMALARAVRSVDPDWSDEILKTALEQLLAQTAKA